MQFQKFIEFILVSQNLSNRNSRNAEKSRFEQKKKTNSSRTPIDSEMNGKILHLVAPPWRLFMQLAWQLAGTQMNSSWFNPLELISALGHEAEDDFVRLGNLHCGFNATLSFHHHNTLMIPQISHKFI